MSSDIMLATQFLGYWCQCLDTRVINSIVASRLLSNDDFIVRSKVIKSYLQRPRHEVSHLAFWVKYVY